MGTIGVQGAESDDGELRGRMATEIPRDDAWSSSPCSSCASSPCCLYLPVYRFRAETRRDIDYALELLRHDMIEIGIYETGWWMVYYRSPCRFLNPVDSKCMVHGTPQQPAICRDYSPVRCWYKRVFSSSVSPDFIRLDLARLERLAARLRYDDSGALEYVPDWDTLIAVVAETPPAPWPRPSANDDAATMPGVVLLFPFATPRRPSDLDLLRFRLGFHGLRVGRSPDFWFLLVQTVRRSIETGRPSLASSGTLAPPSLEPASAASLAPLYDYDTFPRAEQDASLPSAP